MGDDPFFGLKTLAVLLVILGMMSVVVGAQDWQTFRISAGWDILSGVLFLVVAYTVWTEKAGGWRVALGAAALDVLVWAIVAFVLADKVVQGAGVSGANVEPVRAALVSRFRAAFAIAAMIVLWVYPSRHKFVN
jgi:hypothetical protein